LGTVFIRDLVVRGILGVHAWERTQPREIVIQIEARTDLDRAGETDAIVDCLDYARLAEQVTAHAAAVGRSTVEALAADIACLVLADRRVEWVRVRVEKPGAVASCGSVGVEIERSQDGRGG
jgi:dihydroneopterin aldolase